MAAGENPTLRVEDDPATASDALSLHTIAEVDAYASQEQEDADFALALALEQQESQRYARSQAILQGRNPNQVAEPSGAEGGAPPPYRDDPDAVVDEEQVGNLPPYRDDPEAPTVGGDADEAIVEPAKRHRVLRIVRKLIKAWACCLTISTITTIVVIIAVFVLVLVYGTKVNPKELAWQASGSKDYNLKLSRLYPELEEGASEGCKAAWRAGEETQSLQCHRMMLSSAWDKGDSDEANAEGADPHFYKDAVCTASCQGTINRMVKPLAKSCNSRADRFDFASYGKDGKAYFDKRKIDEGPLLVAKTLIERYDRLCKRPRSNRYSQTPWGTCAADLWMNWGIVDGKDEAHLNGLDKFLEQTSIKKVLPARRRTVSLWSPTGVNRTRSVRVQSRMVGPGVGETDCAPCTIDWLERKMRSFEFGQILDPATGKALGLSEFREKLTSAIRRCSASSEALRRVDRKWEELGWWCDGKPCNLDKPEFSEGTMAILHGWPKDSAVLSHYRRMLERKEEPKNVLQLVRVLYDGMLEMPCSIGVSELVAKHEVVPFEHMVSRFCSDRCRNSLDRFITQHSSLFAQFKDDPKYSHYSEYPSRTKALVDRVCLSSSPDVILSAPENLLLPSPENLCAPGYAAVGHPEWIFTGSSDAPTRPEILSAFSKEIDVLAARLPSSVPSSTTDVESKRIQSKKLAESACNTCAGGIFIGSEPNWKKTVDEFLADKDVNGTEYVAAAKKGWMVCSKMHGMKLTEWQKRTMWRKFGLDRYG